MDNDIAELNRLFMLKVREFAHSGQEHKARYLLGVPPDVIHLIKHLTLTQIQNLAGTNISCFSWRIPPSLLKELQVDGYNERESQTYKTHLMASVTQHRGRSL
jgi:Flagellar transcriptional activator (FlhD)